MSSTTDAAAGAGGKGKEREIDATTLWWTAIGGLFVLSVAVTFLIAYFTDQPPNASFVDGTAVLAIVTGIAVGIERIVEVVWAKVDQTQKKGTWWPLSDVTTALTNVESGMNSALEPLVGDVSKLLTKLEEGTEEAKKHNAAVDEASKKIQERAVAAQAAIKKTGQQLAPGSSRFVAIARAADDFTHEAELIAKKAGVWSRELEAQLKKAGDLLSETQDVVGAFKDNPARKTMSISMGVPLGILASGGLGLNMFSAVLGEGTPGYMVGVGGILATGVVVGLGSSPTHEVVKALQRRKEDSTVEVAVGSSVEEVTTEVRSENGAPNRAGVAEAVAKIEGFDSDTVRRLVDVQQFMRPAHQVVTQTTYISNRRTRPIRNTG